MSSNRTRDAGRHTLGLWVTHAAWRHGGKVAVDDRGVSTTYDELDRRSTELAEGFRRAGYGAGDVVATLTGSSVDHIVAFFACAKAGLVLAPLSWRLTVDELAVDLRTVAPQLLLVEPDMMPRARTAVARSGLEPSLGRLGSADVEASVPTRALPPSGRWPEQREPRDDDGVLALLTSGSEAHPKAVLLTHENCFWANLALIRALDMGSEDVVLTTLPQFHVAAWNVQPLAAIWLGATVVLERTFHPGRVLQLIRERRVTTMMGVPTQYQWLATDPSFPDADLSSVRSLVVGGAPISPELARIWASRGTPLTLGYGLTEAGPNVLVHPAGEGPGADGCVGRPYPFVDVRLVDPESSHEVLGAGRGELQVRGPSVFPGYVGDPEATARAFQGGWLRTGDLAQRDSGGRYCIVDRLKNIYITGGENVAPAEVEAALRSHPLIEDVSVVGVADPEWGEVGIAFVAAVPGIRITEQEVLDHARERLARFKVPRRVVLVPELPRTGVGKVARPRLQAMAREMAGGDAW